MEETIVVVAEIDHGSVTPASLEAAAFAGQLGESLRLPLRLVVAGAIDREQAAAAGIPATVVAGAAMAQYCSETWTMSLAPILQSRKAAFVVLAHSSRGADFAPGLAMRMGGSCVTAVESFRREGGAVVFSRPAWNGKLRMDVAPQAFPAVVTVMPGAVKADAPLRKDRAAREGVEIVAVAPAAGRIEPLVTIAAEAGGTRLSEADVIVAVGKGVGSPENLRLVEELAGCFPHSAVAGSRAACDAGWVDHRLQIGQTGKTVAPKLYIACGISGAVQHVAGMRGAFCTAAINRDPQAPIFRVADYGVIEDLTTFLPLLVGAIEKRKRRSPA
jgi:electron transfer flavoprotein alpha subunit